MRNPISLIVLLALLFHGTTAAAQSKSLESISIRTSAVCDMCVTTIEGNLIYEKGVKKVKVDLGLNTIVVDYDPRKTTPDAIRTAITKLGYYADDLPGDPKAFAELPACCQKEGCGKPPAHQPMPQP